MSSSLQILQILSTLLPVIIPLAVIQVGLMVFSLVHLLKRGRVKRGSVALWIVVIVLLNTIGPILYFIFGREDA